MELDLSCNWKLWGESKEGEGILLGYDRKNFDDSDWLAIKELSYLQPTLCEMNPYFGDKVRSINERAWWYRKCFVFPQEITGEERVFLRFEGSDYYTTVYLNGCFLGKHIGHFAPFEFDVTEKLKYGASNVIAVRIESPWDSPNIEARLGAFDRVIRHMAKGLYEHADELIPPVVNPIGLWRPVKIFTDSYVRCKGMKVVSVINEGEADIVLKFVINNYSSSEKLAKCNLKLEGETFDEVVLEDVFSVSFKPDENFIEKTYRIKNPRLWWPWDQGKPDLYRVTLLISDDLGELHTFSQVFGIRSVELVRTSERMYFLINKRKVFIRGVTYIPDIFLSKMTGEKYEKDLSLIKECNANLIRLHVHVDRPEIYDLCDRLGIMIYQDFELSWTHPTSFEWEEEVVPLFKDMIDLLQYHPSIICWCCHNEPVAFWSFSLWNLENYVNHPDPRLYEEALRMDPSRPAFKGSGVEWDYEFSGDSHTYLGSLSGGDYYSILLKKERFNTEYGVGALPVESMLKKYPILYERLKNVLSRIEETQIYQCELLKFYTEYYRRTKFNPCGGCVQFQFVDPWPGTFFGVLDYERNKKKAYDVLRTSFEPLFVCLEYDPHDMTNPLLVWIVNDLPQDFSDVDLVWKMDCESCNTMAKNEGLRKIEMIPANSSAMVGSLSLKEVKKLNKLELYLRKGDRVIAYNYYVNPFTSLPRPQGYPEGFDFYLGIKTFEEYSRNSNNDFVDKCASLDQ